jgi:hypothetical protein
MTPDQMTELYAHQDRCYEDEPADDGVVIVDMATSILLGIGKDLSSALMSARESDEECPYCDCSRDTSMWHAYRIHPYGLSIVAEAYGEMTLRQERLRWEADEGRFRWVGWPKCTACDGDGRVAGPGHHAYKATCGVCHGEGTLEEECDESWFLPPPDPPRGSIWQGTLSPCLIAHRKEEAAR